MKYKCINVGFGNSILAERVIAVMRSESSPMKRLRLAAQDSHRLVDMTEGRKTRSLILLDTNHLILSAIQIDTLLERLNSPALMESSEIVDKEVE